jgi:hypothetical protein
MKGRIVAVCASSTTDFTVAVGACETGIQDYFLQALTVFALEVTHE